MLVHDGKVVECFGAELIQYAMSVGQEKIISSTFGVVFGATKVLVLVCQVQIYLVEFMPEAETCTVAMEGSATSKIGAEDGRGRISDVLHYIVTFEDQHA